MKRENTIMNIKEYLLNHEIIRIGVPHVDAITDIIVDEPFDFIEKIRDMGYFIMRIWWWERIKIGSCELSLGHGGPLDPRDGRYYFGETDFAVYFSRYSSADELTGYVKNFQKEYSQYNLYPGFTIKLL